MTENEISLRDYIAARALQGLLANSEEDTRPPEGVKTIEDWQEHLSALAYAYADAMIERRKQ